MMLFLTRYPLVVPYCMLVVILILAGLIASGQPREPSTSKPILNEYNQGIATIGSFGSPDEWIEDNPEKKILGITHNRQGIIHILYEVETEEDPPY